MSNFREAFENTFHQLCLDKDKSAEFFGLFYLNFVESNPLIKTKFTNTDMEVQRDMLKMSFVYLIDFSQTFEETKRLKTLAQIHSKVDKDITANMYQHWLDALIVTLEQVFPQLPQDTKLAWRIMLAPGIEYMKARY